MKKHSSLIYLLTSLSVFGASFQNLSFERANTNSLTLDVRNSSPAGPVEDLLPGWRVFRGTNELSSMPYNGSFGFEASGGGPLVIGLESFLGPVIEGRFSFGILASQGGRSSEPFTLIQRGDVPLDARFLVFTHRGLTPIVSIDGTTLLGPKAAVADPLTLFADVSRFAGKNVELSFGTPSFPLSGLYAVDNIAFVVPEPSTNALLVLGALALAGRWFWVAHGRRRS